MVLKIAEFFAFEAIWIFSWTLIVRTVWRSIYGGPDSYIVLTDRSWWRFPAYMASFMLLLPSSIIGGMFFGAVIFMGWPK